jgi:hypothetical protein
MAFLPTSGPLSINDINAVFGKGTNLNAYRGTIYATINGSGIFPTGAISISNFYGTSPRVAISYTFASDTPNAILNVSSISGYVAGVSDITITVNSGIYLYATSTGVYALALSGLASGDQIILVNNGFIMGQGGHGRGYYEGAPEAGGPALNLGLITGASAVIDTRSGYIGGGGGGGGGIYDTSQGYLTIYGSGGGAGGGAGGSSYYSGSGQTRSGGAGGGLGQSGGNGQAWDNYSVSTGGGGGRIMPGSKTNAPGAGTPGYGGSAGGTGSLYKGTAPDSGGYGGGANQAGGNAINNSGSAFATGGGGGWGASGGSSTFGEAGGAGGLAANTSGLGVTWTGGFDSSRVFGAIT